MTNLVDANVSAEIICMMTQAGELDITLDDLDCLEQEVLPEAIIICAEDWVLRED